VHSTWGEPFCERASSTMHKRPFIIHSRFMPGQPNSRLLHALLPGIRGIKLASTTQRPRQLPPFLCKTPHTETGGGDATTSQSPKPASGWSVCPPHWDEVQSCFCGSTCLGLWTNKNSWIEARLGHRGPLAKSPTIAGCGRVVAKLTTAAFHVSGVLRLLETAEKAKTNFSKGRTQRRERKGGAAHVSHSFGRKSHPPPGR
jgi:hypothetical protein